ACCCKYRLDSFASRFGVRLVSAMGAAPGTRVGREGIVEGEKGRPGEGEIKPGNDTADPRFGSAACVRGHLGSISPLLLVSPSPLLTSPPRLPPPAPRSHRPPGRCGCAARGSPPRSGSARTSPSPPAPAALRTPGATGAPAPP